MTTPFEEAVRDPEQRWAHWIDRPPPLDWRHLEIWRREWPDPVIVTRGEIHPETNVAGLYWRAP